MDHLNLTHSGGTAKSDLDANPTEVLQVVAPDVDSDGMSESLANLDQLAMSKYAAGKYIEAVELLRTAYELRNKTLGFNHLSTLVTVNNLAAALVRLGKFMEAEQLFRSVLGFREGILGENHVDTLVTVNHLGVVLKQLYRLSDSEAMLSRAYRGFQESLGPGHLSTAECAYNLGLLYVQQGNRRKACESFKVAQTGLAANLGPDHPHAGDAMYWHIKCCLSAKAVMDSRVLRPSKSRSSESLDSIAGGGDSSPKATSPGVSPRSSPDRAVVVKAAADRESPPPENTVESPEKRPDSVSPKKSNEAPPTPPAATAMPVDMDHYLSRNDWVTSAYCTLCLTVYHMVNREHHCRVCSRSVCFDCWGQGLRKSLVWEFSDTVPVKICNKCASQGF